MGHGSHSSTNKDTHSNSIDSQTLTTSSAGTHSATIGGVDWSESFSSNTKLGNYGGTGSLNEIATILKSMRKRITDTGSGGTTFCDNPSTISIPTSTIPSYSTTSGVQASASNLKAFLDNEKVTFAERYQPFTLTLNITSEATSNNTSKKGTAGPVSAQKTQDISGNISGSTDTSWTSTVTGAKGETKSFTYTDDLSGKVITPGTSTDISSVINPAGITKGSKITKEQASAILEALQANTLQSYKGPEEKAYSWSGYNNMAHTSHSSYAS